MPKVSKQPAVKFDRVSSYDQRDGFSLEAQEALGEKYARDRGLEIVRAWSVDESASKEDERTHFFEMIAFVKQNNVKDVIFDKFDRACRGLKSAVLIEELIDGYGVRFHFSREHLVIDRNSPSQEKLRFYLGVILAKYYIDNLRSEIQKGRKARHEAGLWNGKAPLGYLNVREPSSQKATVAVDPVSGPVVRELFELYSTGNYGFHDLADLLNERLPSRTITRRVRQDVSDRKLKPIKMAVECKFTKRIAEEVIANPFYYGDMRVSGEIVKGVHDPLIDKSLWLACQKIRGIRAVNPGSCRSNFLPKPLMGFMTCGLCGHSITGEGKTKKSGRT